MALDDLEMAEQPASEQSLFLAAVAKPSAAERAAYLDQACAGNSALRAEVEALLAAHERLPAGGAATGEELALDSRLMFTTPGTIIGRYKLLEPIGEGGYGTVFMAEQTSPVHRKVALKIIKAGMDTRQVIARFEAERQALALMDHPNIAKVFDAGVTDSGRPYFVMELVKGTPITKYCDDHRLPPRERLQLFVQVCQAIQHAHQKGIIHRDLKPTNVLVAQYDGKPVPKVIDFGVAKAAGQQLTEKTMFTGFGDVIGTPQYMSPEQAELNQLDVDTRSDIYSLGVLLYELLTGSTPLESRCVKEAALLEVLRMIREEEPPKPSTRLTTTEELPSIAAQRGLEPKKLSGLVRGELDWIVMRALEKDRTRRYETANGFAHDLQRYLADEPVLACPPSTVYRAKKFARRNKAALVTASVIVVALLVAVGSFGWMARDRSARHAKVTGQVELILTEVNQFEREQKWPEALAAARRAEAILTSGEADLAITKRVRGSLRDLEFIDRLEQIRVGAASDVTADRFDVAPAIRDYSTAFRDYGVDIDGSTVEASIDHLKRRSTLAIPLAAALDDWGLLAGREEWRRNRRRETATGGLAKLAAVARGIDPDPVRDQLRSVWGTGRSITEVKDELRRIAESIDVGTQHPATIRRLCRALQGSDEAVKVLRDGHYLHPGDFWLNFELGVALDARKDHHGAIRHYTAAIALRPDAAGPYVNLGNALRAQMRPEEGIACYRKAIELDPKLGAAYTNLGGVLLDQNKLDDAIASLRKVVEVEPAYAEGYAHLAHALLLHNELDDAITACHKAIELDPKCRAAYVNQGMALRAQKKPDDAVAALRRAVEIDPKPAGTHFQLGLALRDQKQLDEAIVVFRKSIEIDPSVAIVHTCMGAVLQRQKKLDEAVVAHRKAIELDPKLASAYTGLGSVLFSQKKPEEGLAALRKAAELDPRQVSSLVNGLGQFSDALWSRGEHDEAFAALRETIRLAPADKRGPDHLARRLNERAWKLATGPEPSARNPRRAAELAKEATDLAPKNSEYWNTVGAVRYYAGDFDGAVAALQQSRSLRSSDAEWSNPFLLAMAHQRLGDAEEARRWYGVAVEWMNKKPSNSSETMKRFRREAAELLGVTETR